MVATPWARVHPDTALLCQALFRVRSYRFFLALKHTCVCIGAGHCECNQTQDASILARVASSETVARAARAALSSDSAVLMQKSPLEPFLAESRPPSARPHAISSALCIRDTHSTDICIRLKERLCRGRWVQTRGCFSIWHDRLKNRFRERVGIESVAEHRRQPLGQGQRKTQRVRWEKSPVMPIERDGWVRESPGVVDG